MSKKIFSKEQHKIDLKQIDKDALYIIEKLRIAGYKSYLVGGSVRDLLLQTKPKDFDISTSARPEEIKSLFRNCLLIGRRFRLAHIRFGKKIIEVSTFRSGENDSDQLITRDNVWGDEEDDVQRRDFTINGLFYDPSEEKIIDYVNGYQDIKQKILQTIGNPFNRFKQDPVRMIRLIKFQSRFGLSIEEQTLEALIECKEEIIKSSSTRILEELLKMLESQASHLFFKNMARYGLLNILLPSLCDLFHNQNSDYQLLKIIDTHLIDTKVFHWDRSALASCLVFPVLNKKIEELKHSQTKPPHMGDVYKYSHQVINQVFSPFFLIPKKLKVYMLAILTYQYRLTPLEKKKNERMRVPQDPLFVLALHFLEIRQYENPELTPTFDKWVAFLEQKEKAPVMNKKRKKVIKTKTQNENDSPP
ncbi:MAG: polynucleotide adenylyltransferase PcnB [Rhabdochlamydiaceae bacterium]